MKSSPAILFLVAILLLTTWGCTGETVQPPTPTFTPEPTPTFTPVPPPLNVEIHREPDKVTQPLLPGEQIILIAVLNPDQPATYKWSISGQAQGSLRALGGNSAEYIAGQQAGEDVITVDVASQSGAIGSTTITFNVEVASSPEEPVLADFDKCNSGLTNWGDGMGAAYISGTSNNLQETYVPETGKGCVAQLTYEISDWAAFWLMLGGRDLSAFNTLTFDIKADTAIGVPEQVKIELKESSELLSIIYVSDISDTWQTMSVNFSDFYPPDPATEMPDFKNMRELVFTFEAIYGKKSVVYLDNITFEHR